MDQLATLEFAIGELRREVAALDDSGLDTVTDCEPWTIRQLASHALNNQLLWAGLVTGEEIVTAEETCTDAVRALGLIKDVAPIAPDASDTERLALIEPMSNVPEAPPPHLRADSRDRLSAGDPRPPCKWGRCADLRVGPA